MATEMEKALGTDKTYKRYKVEFYRDFRVDEHLIVNLFERSSSGSMIFKRERFYPVRAIVFKPADRGGIIKFVGMEDALSGAVGTSKEERIPFAKFVIEPHDQYGFEVTATRVETVDGFYWVVSVCSAAPQ
jgi:hypothetical protein